jgi:hypothetical protein
MGNYKIYKALKIASVALLFIVAVNALTAGYSLMVDPDGKGLGMNPDLLKASPFKDFFIPGLVLFAVNGGFSVYVGLLIIRNHVLFPQLVSLQGGILVCWILIQMGMIRLFHPLHLIIGLTGVFLILSGYLMKRGLKLHSGWRTS